MRPCGIGIDAARPNVRARAAARAGRAASEARCAAAVPTHAAHRSSSSSASSVVARGAAGRSDPFRPLRGRHSMTSVGSARRPQRLAAGRPSQPNGVQERASNHFAWVGKPMDLAEHFVADRVEHVTQLRGLVGERLSAAC